METSLVDLQVAQMASLTTDLNFFLYPNLDVTARKLELKSLLGIYYKTYTSIICKAEQKLPFTLQELEEDFKNKEIFGFLVSLVFMPGLHSDCDQNKEEGLGDKLIRLASVEGEFQTQFLSLVDAMVNSSESWISSLK